jgi:hypothetical protein
MIKIEGYAAKERKVKIQRDVSFGDVALEK